MGGSDETDRLPARNKKKSEDFSTRYLGQSLDGFRLPNSWALC
jgi:hypothetical protein